MCKEKLPCREAEGKNRASTDRRKQPCAHGGTPENSLRGRLRFKHTDFRRNRDRKGDVCPGDPLSRSPRKQTVHSRKLRRDPDGVVENEFFGHAKGAFTSAATSQNGIVRRPTEARSFSTRSTACRLSAQVKLLRFLQEKEYRQLGSARTRRADVRFISATNIDLEQAVKQGRFRRDLYYRLNIINFALPPLRERREDVPILVKHFIARYALEFNKEADQIAPDALQKLLLYDWPGNVRELQHVIERAVVFSRAGILHTHDINLPETEAAPPSSESFQAAKARLVIEFEKNYIHSLLVAHNGNITHAAKTAGKNRRAFWELMRKHEIDTSQYRFAE